MHFNASSEYINMCKNNLAPLNKNGAIEVKMKSAPFWISAPVPCPLDWKAGWTPDRSRAVARGPSRTVIRSSTNQSIFSRTRYTVLPVTVSIVKQCGTCSMCI
jgi:hypothetical protein